MIAAVQSWPDFLLGMALAFALAGLEVGLVTLRALRKARL